MTELAPRVTEPLRRRQAEQWARAHHQILRATTAHVVDSLHDQRSALTSLMGFGGLIRLDPQSDQVSGWIGNVLKAADRLRHLQDELRRTMLLPGLQSGGIQSIAPAALAQQLAGEVNHQFEGKGPVVVSDHTPTEENEPIEIFVAAQLLETVLFDLMLDGVATGTRTEVGVRASLDPHPVATWNLSFEIVSEQAASRRSDSSGDADTESMPGELGFTALLIEHLASKLEVDDSPHRRRCRFDLSCLDAKRADEA